MGDRMGELASEGEPTGASARHIMLMTICYPVCHPIYSILYTSGLTVVHLVEQCCVSMSLHM